AVIATNAAAGRSAEDACSPRSQTRLVTGAAAKMRKSMPHNPVTEASCSSEEFPYCEYARVPHEPKRPNAGRNCLAVAAAGERTTRATESSSRGPSQRSRAYGNTTGIATATIVAKKAAPDSGISRN